MTFIEENISASPIADMTQSTPALEGMRYSIYGVPTPTPTFSIPAVQEFMSAPADAYAPTFSIPVLILMAIFAVALLFNSYKDIKTGVLKPWWKPWIIPGACTVAAVIISAVTGTAESIGSILATVMVIAFYVMAFFKKMGGADFICMSLCAIMVGVCLGWIPLLIWVFIGLIFIPAITHLVFKIVYGYQLTEKKGYSLGQAYKELDQKCKGQRIIPAPAGGFIAAVLIWVLMWGL